MIYYLGNEQFIQFGDKGNGWNNVEAVLIIQLTFTEHPASAEHYILYLKGMEMT